MHILYFHQHFTTPQGSSGTRSYEMSQHLVRQGHRVTVVCGSHQLGETGLKSKSVRGVRKGSIHGVEIIELVLPYSNHDGFLKRSLTFIRFGVRSIIIALTLKYDVIFATSTPLTVVLPGLAAKLFRKKPFVFEVRDLWPELPKAMGVIKNPVILKTLSLLEWCAYRYADRCIGLSPGIVDGIVRKAGPKLVITMIPNGCDLELFNPGIKTQRDIPGVTCEDFVAVFCGAMGVANGLEAILDGGAVLKKLGRSDIKIVFIGDGREKRSLMKKASLLGLNDCIFLDPLPKTSLSQLLCTVDVGLMVLANVPAFYYGTSPNKFFDYLASGLPVVSNYPGWIADLLNSNRCGNSCTPVDPEAFAQALIHLADNIEQAREMGRNSRRLAETQFNRRVLAQQFQEFLEGSFPA